MLFYTQLVKHFQKAHRLSHLEAICSWDQATIMPTGGSTARSEAMAELAIIQHNHDTAPKLAEWFDSATSEALSPAEQTSLQAMKRVWQQKTLLPEDLVKAKSLATSQCEHAWRSQRPANDWEGFKKNLTQVVQLSRDEAAIRADATGASRYDSLLDLYEPGVTSATLTALFDDVKTWLPSLIDQAIARQADTVPIEPQGPFPIDQQKKLGQSIMQRLGFDFEHGRLDVSTHPFCGGVPTDVRITTRYNENEYLSALMGVIHETGHARYEQGLPKVWAGLPAGQARSMGVHESQSLFFEMQLARSKPFSAIVAPMLATAFNRHSDPAFTPENIYALSTQVKKGLIRVQADEVTYPAHIILRYEIERALIEGDIEVAHLPEFWNDSLKRYLGLNANGNFEDGCMQDIHWPLGLFGYFPSYTLGAMMAAQFYSAAGRALPQLDEQLARGELEPLFEWLSRNIWQQASLLDTEALLTHATGETLQASYLKQHLTKRYLS